MVSRMGQTASPLERVPTAWSNSQTLPGLILVAVFFPSAAAMATEARGASGSSSLCVGYRGVDSENLQSE